MELFFVQEEELEAHFQNLATHVGPLYKQSAPESYNNQVTNKCQFTSSVTNLKPFICLEICGILCYCYLVLIVIENACVEFTFHNSLCC